MPQKKPRAAVALRRLKTARAKYKRMERKEQSAYNAYIDTKWAYGSTAAKIEAKRKAWYKAARDTRTAYAQFTAAAAKRSVYV